jgi:hypothetical protein
VRHDIGGESQNIGARSQDEPTAARYNLLRFNTTRAALEMPIRPPSRFELALAAVLLAVFSATLELVKVLVLALQLL